jgi:UPF0716 protein FxsA
MALLLLFLVFVVLPIAELYVIIQVGGAIGVLPTLALLLLDGLLGAWLARTQGRAAWRRFNEATAAGRVPAKEVYDGAAIIFGGALLLSPGFITDILGVFLLLPPTRALLRKTLMRGARYFGPTRGFFFLYDRIPGTGQGSSGGRRPGPGPQPGPGPGPEGPPPPRPASRGYDVDGTAREIPDDEPVLERGRREGNGDG